MANMQATPAPERLRALLVLRVSDDKKRDGASIAGQHRETTAMADRFNADIVHTIETEESASAYGRQKRGGGDRKSFVEIMEWIETQPIDFVIIREQSRLTRDKTEWALIERACLEHGVRLIADGVLVDLSDESAQLTTGVTQILSVLEVARLSRRIRRGNAESVADGRPPGGHVPFGYKRMRENADGTGKVMQFPDPEKQQLIQETVKYILDCRASGTDFNMSAIARHWDQTLPREEGGKPRESSTITTALRNPALMGMRVHNGNLSPGAWEPILDPNTFHSLQDALNDERRKSSSVGVKPRHLPTAVCVCGECGGRFRHDAGGAAGRRDVYTCRKKRCVSRSAAYLHAYCVDAAIKVLSADLLARARNDHQRADANAVAAAMDALTAAQTDRVEFLRSLFNAGFNAEEVKIAREGIDTKIKSAEAELKRVRAAQREPTQESFRIEQLSIPLFRDPAPEVIQTDAGPRWIIDVKQLENGHVELATISVAEIEDRAAQIFNEEWDFETRRNWMRSAFTVEVCRAPVVDGKRTDDPKFISVIPKKG